MDFDTMNVDASRPASFSSSIPSASAKDQVRSLLLEALIIAGDKAGPVGNSLPLSSSTTARLSLADDGAAASVGLAAPSRSKKQPKQKRIRQKPKLSSKFKKQPKQKKIRQKPKLKVKHDYQDYSQSSFSQFMESHPDHKCARELKGSLSFPRVLHAVLEHVKTTGQEEIISWCSHGRAFAVHDDDVFVSDIMPLHFRQQSKFTSFQRQLNIYGFRRLTKGRDKGAYYHELFLRGKVDLCRAMSRITVKGTNRKAAKNPDDEPDFYEMPQLNWSSNHSAIQMGETNNCFVTTTPTSAGTAKYAGAASAAATTTSTTTTTTQKAQPTKPTAHKTMSILSSALAVSLPSKLSGSLKEPSTCNSGMEEMGLRASMLTKSDSDASISTTLHAHTDINQEGAHEEGASTKRGALYTEINNNNDTQNQLFKELGDDILRPRPLAPPTQGEVDNRSYYKASFPDSESRSMTMAETEAPALPDDMGYISVSDEEYVEGEDFSEFVW